MAGRKPKTDKLKELTGNPGKRPMDNDTTNLEVETVDSLQCPVYLRGDKRAKAEWERVCTELVKYKMLCSLDLHILGVYCKSVSSIHEAYNVQKRKGFVYEDNTGRMYKNPMNAIIKSLTTEIRMYSAVLGLNPSARKSLRVKKEVKDDKKAAILKYMKGGADG